MSEAFDKIRSEEQTLLCRSYSRYPVAIVKGEGSRLWDIDGKEYIDLLSGIAVIALGHCNPELCEALAVQSHKLWHVSNLFYQEEQLELAKALLSTTHHDKAFFCNSGAEANEACIKLARRAMRRVRNRDAWEIISIRNCFHGRTLATLAATGRDSLSNGFEPLPAGFLQVPASDITALKNAISPRTAAVMVEVVQGESGVCPLPEEYLRKVQEVCRENGIFFICDEVQAGMCRTGRFWAFQHYGLEPDAISIAKSLANGLPIGAMLATDEMAQGFTPGSHASTFGGGALVAAVADRTVEIMLEDNLAARAMKLGEHVFARLGAIKERFPEKIACVRGLGLMIGIELTQPGEKIFGELLKAGFVCNLSHGKVLRLLPPLVISQADLDAFMDKLEDLLAPEAY